MSLTTQLTVIICVFLLAVNAALGLILMSQSGSSLKTLIRNHMIAVSSTAASLINGDTVDALTAEDVGGDIYNDICRTLTTVINVQKDQDIKYIYIVKKVGDEFIFIVDPDPEEPAAFGETCVYTDARESAWNGVPDVDSEAVEDRWGCFYTAWSPIKDSSGKTVAIIGTDFVPDWYDDQITSHTISVLISAFLSLFLGGIVVFILASKIRRRFSEMNNELTVLSGDLNELSAEINDCPEDVAGDDADRAEDENADAIVSMSVRIRSMQVKLKKYLVYIHEQAYTDSMTSVGNKTAYIDRIKELNEEIANGNADFALAIFDINGLKNANDNYGHEVGDSIITDTADKICKVFPNDPVFRIGGDEFVAVAYSCSEEELFSRFGALDSEIAAFNAGDKEYEPDLSLSHGGAVFEKGTDVEFRDVFRRADKSMYEDKADHYRRTGEEQHSSEASDELPNI